MQALNVMFKLRPKLDVSGGGVGAECACYQPVLLTPISSVMSRERRDRKASCQEAPYTRCSLLLPLVVGSGNVSE